MSYLGNVFKIFLFLIKESIFDHKDEYDLKSHKLNMRKVSFGIVMVILVFITYLSCYRMFHLAADKLELKKKLTVCEQKTTQQK